MTHNFINPSQYKSMDHVESRFDLDNPIFYDYFTVPELNVSANLSFNNPTQSKIFDIDAHT
jgi:hypothetical protein